ncbi:hypothetical protein GCM10011371_29450 [Novosphingobium marinum]|uniref:Chitooligosaccharide deacetylase n=1 Tax=Novosphingobium marinum TaxID=1514948 RepID=A0A7Y9Y133_9SPHN|nr:polysaccharide deacetylase family protein [Novosphingobium marinum]NYH96793.1 hypothetical protein [Novosphingobium marinum]GGC40195.1 hypothetical protein GCM10011371_29450 [Novosphingobium marinum]
MTRVYITIDTEYSAGMAKRLGPGCRAENFRRSIACETPSGSVGVPYQMDVFDDHGLKAVFFVDPMPALIWGVEAISDVVAPIVERGHDVQLHLHTEWLELAGDSNPLGNRTGLNLRDFSFDEQCGLIEWARDTLVAAGAPAPTAFRAGNYGADDDTLLALGELGLTHDTSHCPGIAGSHCAISLGPEDREPVEHRGVVEVPVGCIAGFGDRLRHAQVTALSAAETLAAIGHARDCGAGSFTLVSHSFELLSRDRAQVNQVVRRRFAKLCAGLAAMPGVRTATYADDAPRPAPGRATTHLLPCSPLRTGMRYAEQAVSNALYGAG